MTLSEKVIKLKNILSEAGSVIIACSGGTDSTYLLYAASTVKNIRLLAVTISSPFMHSDEICMVKDFCSERGIEHRIIEMSFPDNVKMNPPDRCYLCKKEIIALIQKEALSGEYKQIFDGTNADDLKDFRPGMKALQEEGIRSPLLEAGLTKDEIRKLSKEAGLITWNKPANACLMTRFPHNTLIKEDDLKRVERAEMFINSLGLTGIRVRVHGDLARIEYQENDLEKIIEKSNRKKIIDKLNSFGFKYITIDLEGYVKGRMNIKLKHDECDKA